MGGEHGDHGLSGVLVVAVPNVVGLGVVGLGGLAGEKGPVQYVGVGVGEGELEHGNVGVVGGDVVEGVGDDTRVTGGQAGPVELHLAELDLRGEGDGDREGPRVSLAHLDARGGCKPPAADDSASIVTPLLEVGAGGGLLHSPCPLALGVCFGGHCGRKMNGKKM